jgi:hypothetical protein
MLNLEAAGVNLAEINLEPVNKLANRRLISDTQLHQAVDALYTPRVERTPTQGVYVSTLQENIVPHGNYTAAQRDETQLDFLRRLEKLRLNGVIAGSMRFVIHQRLWFRTGANPKGEARRRLRAAQFASDMASFIKAAERNGLDHWVVGVRLGEHSNNDMNELLPLIIELAHAINVRTNGWLRTHSMIVNGGGWGAEYKGIDRVVNAAGLPYPFFAHIAAEAGSFAFGYKWMQFHDHMADGIVEHMAMADCADGLRCNQDSVSDWETYLGDILGFNELITYLAANRSRYPFHANVVFVGDDSDAATSMVELGDDGRLNDSPPLTALRSLFARIPDGARGQVFMNGYSTTETMRDYVQGDPVDIGRALYLVNDCGRVELLPQSKRIWENWRSSVTAEASSDDQ